jgi:hypothetical protein
MPFFVTQGVDEMWIDVSSSASLMSGTVELHDGQGTVLDSWPMSGNQVQATYTPDGTEASGSWSLLFVPDGSLGGSVDYSIEAGSWHFDDGDSPLPPVPAHAPRLVGAHDLPWDPIA